MAKHVQRYRLASAVAATHVGLEGECIVSKDDWTIRVHDGVTPGGFALAKIDYVVANFVSVADLAAIDAILATLAPVAFSGAYASLTGKPTLSTLAGSGNWADIIGKPAFVAVATSGAYGDLSGLPTISAVGHTGAYADLSGKPTLGTAAAKNITISNVGPSGGADGDVWLRY